MSKNVAIKRAHGRLMWLASLSLLTMVFTLTAGAGAQATTGTGHQNPSLSVTVLVSPDTATTGDTVTATETVTNTSSVRQTVVITGTLTTPDGATKSRSITVILRPRQSWTHPDTHRRFQRSSRHLHAPGGRDKSEYDLIGSRHCHRFLTQPTASQQ